MTPICDEHAALLKAVAKNTNDLQVKLAYADWLMERGNAGWIIVRNWPCWEWMKWINPTEIPEKLRLSHRNPYWDYFKIPWLDGVVRWDRKSWANHHLQRAKAVLTLYAEGKAVV